MTETAFFDRYAPNLNDQQRKAVRAVDGAVLLLAVPGSGKTTVLVTRLGYMCLVRGVDPAQILTMTYTVAAAGDMKRRFSSIFGKELGDRLEFRTINGVSARIIRTCEQYLGRKAFSLLEDEKLLNEIVREKYTQYCGEYPTDAEVRSVRAMITYAKNGMLSMEEVEKLNRRQKGFSSLFAAYRQRLREEKSMDYDDQMGYALQILEKYPPVLEAFRTRCTYLCVDEAQDTSRIQHRLIHALARMHGNIFMVGDEDQSIYGFRAACPEELVEFQETYPGARVLYMETNYRSTTEIVSTAAEFISRNQNRREKHMTAARGRGDAIERVKASSRLEQYRYLARLAADCREETAVLYRENDSALPLIDLMERQGIPYRCRRTEMTFFTHRAVRDATDILRFAYNDTDGEIFLRIYYKLHAGIPKPAAQAAANYGAGEPILLRLSRDESISDYARSRCLQLLEDFTAMRQDGGEEAVRRIYAMGYGDYLEEQGLDGEKLRILAALGAQEDSGTGLLRRLGELETVLREKHEVQSPFLLSTVHSSKGLEYRNVYLMDVIDGVFPQIGGDIDPEEERRIFYVAMTRAMERLHIFTFSENMEESAFSRAVFGRKATAKPGLEMLSESMRQASADVRTMADALEPGKRVRHAAFGAGIVMACSGGTVSVRFSDGTTRTLALRLSLEKGLLEVL